MSNAYQMAIPMGPYLHQQGPTDRALVPGVCDLAVRQNPKQGLVTLEGKAKTRKPLDPPPIIQLTVAASVDAAQEYLINPFILGSMSLWTGDGKGPVESSMMDSLTGTLVSSLHRLKDPHKNEDGAYFIFGDISVKIVGKFRLCMALHEIRPEPVHGSAQGSGSVQFLGYVLTEPFEVVAAKDFKGLEESTHLSRSFSDQGVRLRLRKETRGMMGTKRQREDEDSVDPSIAPQTPKYGFSQQKRIRTELFDSPVTSNLQAPPLQTGMPPQHMVMPRNPMQHPHPHSLPHPPHPQQHPHPHLQQQHPQQHQQHQQQQHPQQHMLQQHPPPPSIPNSAFNIQGYAPLGGPNEWPWQPTPSTDFPNLGPWQQ